MHTHTHTHTHTHKYVVKQPTSLSGRHISLSVSSLVCVLYNIFSPPVCVCVCVCMCVNMCVCPWSGPLISPLTPSSMPLLRPFLRLTNKLHALHFVFSLSSLLTPPHSSSMFFLSYLIRLPDSTLSPGCIPSGLLLSLFILYTPHPSFFSSPPSATFFRLHIYPSALFNSP